MRRRFGGTSSPQMEPGSAGRCICDGAAQLAAQRADRSRVVPPKGSKSRSNQPPAAGGPSIKPPPKKPDCSGQAGVSAWRHHPARCRDCTTPITAADSDLPSAGQQRKLDRNVQR